MSWCKRRFFREPRMSRSGTRLRRSRSEIKRGGVDTTNPIKQASIGAAFIFS
jgi:hypothetical protein